MAAQPDEDAPLLLELHNPYPHEALFHLVVYWGSLPKAAHLYLALAETGSRGSLASLKKEELKQAGLEPGGRKARELFEAPLEERCGERVRLDLDRIYCLSPDENRRTTLPEILIRPERPAVAALRLVLPKKLDGAPPQFDVVQMTGTRVVGGCTFVVKRG
jgi:hypothetical protein